MLLVNHNPTKCAIRLAQMLGLTTVEVELAHLSGIDCIIVERYERHRDEEGVITRIHQEDACQALAIDPSANQGNAKYEIHGGPSLRQIWRATSARPSNSG